MYDGGGGRGEGPVRARVMLARVPYELGTFPTRDEADAARVKARKDFALTGKLPRVQFPDVRERQRGDFHLWYWSHFEAGRERERTEEEKWLAAVARDAIVVRLKSRRKGERLEAARWVRSNSRHLFGFVTICEQFGIDVASARGTLLGED